MWKAVGTYQLADIVISQLIFGKGFLRVRFEETVGISHLLRLADHAMKRRMDQVLARWRLTAAQYMALSAIESKVGLTNAELARECGVTPQTSNRLIEGLIDAGLIKRTADPVHGRKLTLVLTKKALTLVCEAHVGVNQIELDALAGLNKSQVTALQAALRGLIECLARDE